MCTPDTFLTALYVAVDEILFTAPPMPHPGPQAGLWPSEVVTLALFSQWARFGSERDFYRYATTHLRPAFPTLPSRTQLNRLIRGAHAALLHVSQRLAARLGPATYEILDGTGVRARNRQRRGVGWLPDRVAIGRCARLGWYEGFRLLLDITPRGAITGYGVGPANTNDRQLAETFLALRATPDPAMPSIGPPVPSGIYVADSGFSGKALERRYHDCAGATVVCPPQPNSRRAWSPAWRRWLAQHRQLVETVIDRLLTTFRLDRDRPHTFTGFDARLAAKIALHNFCLWFNTQRGQPPLTIATLPGW
jgi:hypothetical protein